MKGFGAGSLEGMYNPSVRREHMNRLLALMVVMGMIGNGSILPLAGQNFDPTSVAGKMTIDGQPASAGTEITIQNLDTGHQVRVEVDGEYVCPYVKGEGRFETGCILEFSPGERVVLYPSSNSLSGCCTAILVPGTTYANLSTHIVDNLPSLPPLPPPSPPPSPPPDLPDDLEIVTFRLSLYEGWNLISVPLEPCTPSVGQIFGNLSGLVDTIWSFDNGEDRWVFYRLAETDWNGGLEEVSLGAAYWVYLSPGKGRTQLAVKGRLKACTMNVSAGWNMVGVPSTDPLLTTAFSDLNWESIWGFDGEQQRWFKITPDMTCPLKPGLGYWIFVN